MELEKQLRRAGLSKSEIRIYLYILENGLSTPPQIAKGTGIARTNTYHILRSLKEKELVESQTKGARSAFIATDPSAIVRNIEERRVAMETILPDLRALYRSQKNKPVIKFLADKNQILQGSFVESLESEEVLFIGSTNKAKENWPEFFTEYERLLKKKGVILKDLMPHDSAIETAKGTRAILGDVLYEAFALPKKYRDIPTNILIWNDSVALISLDVPTFGTVLKNKHLADTFRILFDIASSASARV